MGGYNNVKGALRSTEIYNITTGLWNATSDYVIATFDYEMVRLPNGLVLAYGGFDSSVYWNLAALYDPSNGVWSPTASLAPERGYFQMKLLQDDTVLACGGNNLLVYLSDCHVYTFDSATMTGSWSNTTTPLATARSDFKMTVLRTGHVLAAGGDGDSGLLASAELYDPATGDWTSAGALSSARIYLQMALLSDGNALAAGGRIDNFNSNPPLGTKSADVYDVASGTWSATGPMLNTTYGRYNHQMLLLSGL